MSDTAYDGPKALGLEPRQRQPHHARPLNEPAPDPDVYDGLPTVTSVLEASEVKMRFEIGKFYKHNGGSYLHILGRVKTTLWDDCLVAEEAGRGENALVPVGEDEGAAENWTETTYDDWMTNFGD